MSFFRRLGHRLGVDPNPQAERELLRKLDAEWKSPRTSLWSLAFLRFAPLTAMATLLIIFANHLDTQSVVSPSLVSADPRDVLFLVDSREGLEFYDELEDWMLTASAEDWDLLLATDEGNDG